MFWLSLYRFFNPLDCRDPLTQATELARLAEIFINAVEVDCAASERNPKRYRRMDRYPRLSWRPLDSYLYWRSLVQYGGAEVTRLHDLNMDVLTRLRGGSSWRNLVEEMAVKTAHSIDGASFKVALLGYAEEDVATNAATDAERRAEFLASLAAPREP